MLVDAKTDNPIRGVLGIRKYEKKKIGVVINRSSISGTTDHVWICLVLINLII